MRANDAPRPTLLPLLRLMPPARRASFDLSTALAEMSPPEMVVPVSPEAASAKRTAVLALLTMIATAPPMETLLFAPETAPARACAPSWPAKSPSRFCVRRASREMEPLLTESTSPIW